MIHPELLRTFLAVADAGTFTGAARALGLRQSTVSQQIRRLEDAVGRRLLDRDTHRVAITAEGEGMRDHARYVLDAHERMGPLPLAARHCAGGCGSARRRISCCRRFPMCWPNSSAVLPR